MDDNPVMAHRYKTEVVSYSQIGNMKISYELFGHSACDLISQFQSVQLAEKERGYNAFLSSAVYEQAERERASR